MLVFDSVKSLMGSDLEIRNYHGHLEVVGRLNDNNSGDHGVKPLHSTMAQDESSHGTSPPRAGDVLYPCPDRGCATHKSS